MGHLIQQKKELMPRDKFVSMFASYRINGIPDTLMAKYKVVGKLGSGERFARLKSSLAKKGATNPGALAAYIGRKKYGKSKFQKLAAKGKKGY